MQVCKCHGVKVRSSEIEGDLNRPKVHRSMQRAYFAPNKYSCPPSCVDNAARVALASAKICRKECQTKKEELPLLKKNKDNVPLPC